VPSGRAALYVAVHLRGCRLGEHGVIAQVDQQMLDLLALAVKRRLPVL